MPELVISVGQVRENQAGFVELFNNFVDRYADTARSVAQLSNMNDLDVATQRALAEQIVRNQIDFQRQATDWMRNAGMMTAEEAALAHQTINGVNQELAAQRFAAENRLGQLQDALNNSGLSNIAKWSNRAGVAGNIAELAHGAYNSLKEGNAGAFSQALGGMAAFTVGGALGGLVGGLVGMAFMSLFGLGLMGMFLGGLILGFAVGLMFKDLLGEMIGDGWHMLLSGIASLFTGGQMWMPRRDPLTLDLDGDGIESIGINSTNPVMFDHDGDGLKNGTGWISPDDGFLVLDRNGNGTIDNGRELFGDSTPVPGGTAADGFAALAVEDTNHDGVVNASDARFANLRVWRDLNQNGISEGNELFSLQQLGIVAINVGSVERNQVLGNGNQIADVGTFVRSDGTEGSVGETHGTADVDLVESTFYREFPDQIPLADGIEELPNAQASGRVRDLWEAASMSSGLRTQLENYSALTTREQQLQALDSLLLSWAQTAGMQTMEQRADAIDHAFGWWKIGEMTYPGSGIAWTAAGGNPSGGAVSMPADFPDPNAWEALRDNWEALVRRTNNLFTVLEAFNGRYFFSMPEDDFQGARTGVAMVAAAPAGGGGGGSVAYSWGPPGITVGIDTPQLDMLNASYQMLREAIYTSLVVQTRLQPVNDLILLHFSDSGVRHDFSAVNAELDSRITQNAASGMADLLDYTRAQQRTFVGKEWRGWELVGDYIRSLDTAGLEAVYTEFGIKVGPAGQTSWSGDARNNVLVGGAAGEGISAGEGNDAIVAGGGNDSLSGDGGADALLGEQGNDYLYGGDGEDILEGGTGNDWMQGGTGSDIYVFRRGDGQDTIDNNDWSGQGAHDTLRLGDGIRISDVRLSSSWGSLQIDILHSTDRIVIGGDLFNDSTAIDEIDFNEGASWNLATLREMVKVGGAGNDTFVGHNEAAALYGNGGNDSLTGGDGNDTLDGGDGNDILVAGAGEDVLTDWYGTNELRGGAGNDTITGAGLIEGGTGDDIITGTGSADVYLYDLGDGADTIYENGYPWIADTLRFGAAITPEALTLTRTGDDMVLRFNEQDSITIKSWYSNNWYTTIEQFEFANGTHWNLTNLQALTPAPYIGTENGDSIPGWDGIDVIDGAGGNDTLNGAAGSDQLSGGDGNDTINAGTGNDVVSGGAGDDVLNGDDGNDALDGGDGNDTITDWYASNTLRGGAGNDIIAGSGTIEGGTGNDTLTGSGSADTYLFDLGDGADTIYENGYSWIIDTLQFGAGISASNLVLERSLNDIVFRVGGSDQVTVKNWFSNNWYATVENLRFADGTLLDIAALQQLMPLAFTATNDGENIAGWDGIDLIEAAGGNDTINGAAGNDQLSGGDGNDTINAGTGNDIVSGGAGDDVLNGDDGNDVIEGGDGNDTITDWYATNTLRGGAGNDIIAGSGTIDGGTGNDTLTGSGSADTYLFNLGDGADTIYENGYSWIIDALQFGAGISTSDISLARSGDDIVFRVGAGGDQVTVKNWFSNNWYATVEQFRFADGATWSIADVQAQAPLTFAGSAGADTIAGWDGIDIIDGGGGNDTINGAAGNDQLAGGEGNDTINAGTGNDIVSGGAGDDILNGDDGNDVIEGGDGNDTITDWYATNTLRGGAGNDTIAGTGTLEGGAGNDTLTGSGSADTYVFSLGDGADTISENGYSWIIDSLQLGAGIAVSDLQLVRSGNDMVFRFNANDQVTVKNWFSNNWYATVENLRFADGTTLDLPALQQLMPVAFTGTAAADNIAGWDGIDLIEGAGGNDTINGAAGNDQLSGGDGNDTINAGTGNDTVSGGAGDDILNGDDGNDVIDGGDGNDTITDWYASNTLRGGAGNDTIAGTGSFEGGAGNDTLTGSGSADTYVFNLGDGADTISENGYNWIIDALQLGAGIAASDLQLVRSGNDMVFRFNANDQVTVKNWFSNNWYATVENLRFADGTTLDLPALQQLMPVAFTGTAAADNIAGWDGIDLIDGAGGNDTINAAAGNDQLTGGDGNDTINAGTGNDTVSGGAGDDILNGDDGNDVIDGGDGNDTITDWYASNTLRGGAGNDTIAGTGSFEGGTGNDTLTGSGSADTYVFNLGDGADTISENGYNWVIDALQLGAGIASSDLGLIRSGNDMVFRFNASDQVTVKNWFSNNWYATVENLRFADGTVLDLAGLQQITPQAFTGTNNGESLQGWDGIDLIDGAGGNDTINGAAGNDQLTGGDGNDTINAGTGNDTVSGGAGDDILNGDDGNDVIDGGDGNDTITDWYAANTLRGGAGNDTITGTGSFEGGTGNDALTGGGNADTYVFNLGDGADTITESGYNWVIDTLRLGAGINRADLALARSGNDIVFKFNASDQVTVKNWYSNNWYATVESLQFADGTSLDLAGLQQIVTQPYSATDSAETISGWDGADVINAMGGDDTVNAAAGHDVIDGGDGNDTLNAGYGNDTVNGGAGNDTIDGSDGNDVLDGGDGNDNISDAYGSNVLRGGAGNDVLNGSGTLSGGTGNDTITGTGGANLYLYDLGNGADVLNDFSYYNTEIDTLRFGAGIDPAALTAERSGNDLIFRISATDSIKVTNWFYSVNWYGLERVEFADGTAWNIASLANFAAGATTGGQSMKIGGEEYAYLSGPAVANAKNEFLAGSTTDRVTSAPKSAPGIASWTLMDAVIAFNATSEGGGLLGDDAADSSLSLGLAGGSDALAQDRGVGAATLTGFARPGVGRGRFAEDRVLS